MPKINDNDHCVAYVSAATKEIVGNIYKARIGLPDVDHDLLQAIANVTIASSLYEHMLRTVLKRANPLEIKQWKDGQDAKRKNKVSLANRLIDAVERNRPEALSSVKKIIEKGSKSYSERNDVVHGLWVEVVGKDLPVWFRKGATKPTNPANIQAIADKLIETCEALNQCIPPDR